MANGRMLTLLRESRGWSGTELSKRSGVPQSTISKIENGLTVLEGERLQQLAAALEYPEPVFSWTDPVYGFGSAAFFHRKQQALPQLRLRQIHAEVNLIRMRLRRLLTSVELDVSFKVPAFDVDEMGTPSEVARAVRAAWRLPMGPVRNLLVTLERAGIFVLRADLGSPKIAAISLDAVFPYPAVIVLNEGMPADRERFTLAHELAHFVMHSVPGPSESAEAEANEFAAEFLMPADEIRAQLKGLNLARAAQLKLSWQVAMSAVIRRARDLRVIDETRYRSLLVSMSQKGWSRNEPGSFSREEPTVLDSVLRVHLGDHGYSVAELAEVVGVVESEFRLRFNVEPSRPNLRAVK